ncbi:MAG: CDP-alcohol phosphatidyltransferase family protein [Chloroflexi bacterium]|nr:CDP-alcohol phosphatidyltransferase family protein [Chloroflexota bacterium]MCY3937576.1 CDP-alcohol phosphatidyltransferase family protein [Chloroflexota bacterium]
MRGSYSTLETRALGPFRALLARILIPIVWLLVKLKVPPNAVSLSQIPVGIVAASLVAYSPRVSFLLFVIAVVIDGIDGALARRLGKESAHGALVDQVSDHAREIAMIAGLAFSGALNGGLAAAYAFSHPFSNFMLYLGSAKLVRAPFAVKTWMSFYPFLFLYLWFEINYLDIAAAISTGAMVIVSFWLLWSLRNRM